jgi:hypothetical protein
MGGMNLDEMAVAASRDSYLTVPPVSDREGTT